MGVNKFGYYKKRGVLTVKIECPNPEKILNMLWENRVEVRNVRRLSIICFYITINFDDYQTVRKIIKQCGGKFKIINRKGALFFIMKLKHRIAMILGIFVFIGMIYYLSTFIWQIKIVTEKNIAPFEIREQLKNIGVYKGVSKGKVDVHKIEEEIMKKNDRIAWVKVRMEGAILNVKIAERQNIANSVDENSPSNIVAKKDGEIVRLYSTAGTCLVKPGDIVRKGQELIRGEQGKEDSIYLVHAKGDVIAKTFYEKIKYIKFSKTERKRTGKKIENTYIKIGNKKIYIKKNINKFEKYDKIKEKKLFYNKEIYYEVEEKSVKLDANKLKKETIKELYDNIVLHLDKSINVVDKIVSENKRKDGVEIRVVVVCEENISEEESIN